MFCGTTAALTDGCKDVGETEVVHSVKGKQVVQKLLLLIIAAEEGVALVQFSRRKRTSNNKQSFLYPTE